MNPTTRSVIAICLTLVSLIVTLNRCHQQRNKQYQFEHTWTPELEAQMRDVFNTQTANVQATYSAKRAYADCCFEKIKAAFPNGLSSMSPDKMTDSVRIAVIKMCAECTSILTKSIDVWQPDVVQQLKLQFYSYPETKLFSPKIKPEYVDCLAFKVETQFPNGMTGASKDSIKKVIEKARHGCVILLVNKYKKQKDTTSRK